MYKEIEGDLIALAKTGTFDVIAHGCNCFCIQGSGLAPQMVAAFNTDRYPLEGMEFKGDINKLGNLDYKVFYYTEPPMRAVTATFHVVNCYTQYGMGPDSNGFPPLDFDALIMCLKKLNHVFKGKKIGLPQIGCGLAGGDWESVKAEIKMLLNQCDVTVVIYRP